MKKMSQKEQILVELLSGKKLTAFDVWNSLYIQANTFHARIQNLKNERYPIMTEMITIPSGKKVAQHYLPEEFVNRFKESATEYLAKNEWKGI